MPEPSMPSMPSGRSATSSSSEPGRSDELDPEDAKLVTLARAARARTAAREGAAVRDETGRTYVAVTVELASLSLGALAGAVVAAVSSGARSLEAAAVVTTASAPSAADVAAARDLGGPAVPVLVASPDGVLHAVLAGQSPS
jgi:4-aminobutyrate aminotransferase-like enzyme